MLLTGFGLGLLAILLVIITRDFYKVLAARVFLILLIATAGFLLDRIVPDEWRWLTASLTGALPALFWLLCQYVFARRPDVKTLWGALAFYSFFAPIVARIFSISSTDQLYLVAKQIPVYVEYVIMLHGIWVVVVNWSDDLVDSRRELRGAFLSVVGAALIWASWTLNFGYGERNWLPALISVAALIVAMILLKGRKGVLLSTVPVVDKTAQQEKKKSTSQQEIEAAKLTEIMNAGFYRTEKLTLSMLAQKMQLPEYKTRSLINQTLGYRNFNDYINQLRIADASKRLISDLEAPILNVALDVGYRTLSSFNRAFKEIQGLNPTDYRAQKSTQQTQ
ncbi:helix-turn-helix domain-containing protein [Planctobacterium marinum]|uniref:Transcriptional regulator n=1 Tax=Planctobacterium marinum TaxID=1631968 RepID=A0AA48HY84_9ALTE|nr:transcriptional regulator [Planctobacterium marinum]